MTSAAPATLRYESVASTMDLIHELGERGAPAGTVVVAAEQTGGRGSRGRPWHSPRGGVWLTLLSRPSRAGTELLSLRAGLALARALEVACPGLRVGLKWPNDLMWEARKVGGVLLEVRWSGDDPAWAAVGVGINVTNPLPPDLATTAVALAEHQAAPTPEALLDLLLPGLRGLDGETPRLAPEELAELRRRDWLRGRELTGPEAGVVEGIAPDGALLVRRQDGARAELRAGTIRLAHPAGRP